MSTSPAARDWLEVDRTFVPALPADSRLTVFEVSPARFVVTYATHAASVYWMLVFVFGAVGFLPLAVLSILIGAKLPQLPMPIVFFGLCAGIPTLAAWLVSRLFDRPEGGKICLERHRLSFQRGAVFRASEKIPVTDGCRFDVEDIGGDENTVWALQLVSDGKAKLVAHQQDLPVPDLKWLSRRLNEWLGREFPSHCVQCGWPLETVDLDWQQRSVQCTACGFAGPSTDPFAVDAAPAPPAASCPSCLDSIWLSDVNRETGGCRCRRCGWTSAAEPPMRLEEFSDVRGWFADIVEQSIGKVFDAPKGFLSETEIWREFPSEESAWSQLSAERLIAEEPPGARIVTYRFQWLTKFPIVVTVLVLAAVIVSLLFYRHYHLPQAQRNWTYYVDRTVGLAALFASYGSLGGLLWWSRQTVTLNFTPYALQWTVGGRKRLIAWHTLSNVAVLELRWPPVLLLKHGGAGLFLVAPSHTAARALAALCLQYRSAPAVAEIRPAGSPPEKIVIMETLGDSSG